MVVGGGFGGLYAVQHLRRAPVDVTLIDRRNFHLFQPLLYQVATGAISPGDMAAPLRSVLKKQRNVRVVLGDVRAIDARARHVSLGDGSTMPYDRLVVATGARHAYFGHDEWERLAPGLKTIEDALEIRRRILLAFETAERERDPERRRALQTFVVVGGGPTGVELAGAIGEIAFHGVLGAFRRTRPRDTRILLVEGLDRILPSYRPELSASAERALQRLGVTCLTRGMVTAIDEEGVTVRREGGEERIATRTVLWAAGVRASSLGQALADSTGAELDRVGRVLVQPDLTIAGHPEIFVIGDLATFTHQGERPLPGVAPVAIQQGKHVAAVLSGDRAAGTPFRYWDKGSLATIGRGSGVADLGLIRFSGFLAWIAWLFVHLFYLVEFDNRVVVLAQWTWNFLTRNRGNLLITGAPLLPDRPSGEAARPPAG